MGFDIIEAVMDTISVSPGTVSTSNSMVTVLTGGAGVGAGIGVGKVTDTTRRATVWVIPS